MLAYKLANMGSVSFASPGQTEKEEEPANYIILQISFKSCVADRKLGILEQTREGVARD